MLRMIMTTSPTTMTQKPGSVQRDGPLSRRETDENSIPRENGNPQWGQATARVETCFPHSGQSTKDIRLACACSTTTLLR